ncbi:hypothetical protein LIP_2032 [Limnochorda pilosa]|uniref:N-acetyltransferase domain-containing protein n=1 Tax=Limnochorda pilosa TaxID=1555112 RepID=A0A0K2SL81_LIMPI|nr:hypothetical protein LIP_2032 [Limnochorda pilosa]
MEGLPPGYTVEAVEGEGFHEIFRQLRRRVFDERTAFEWRRVLTDDERRRLEDLEGRLAVPWRIRHQLLFKHGDEIAGWYFGVQESAVRYVMINTGLFPEHRRKGIYTALLHSLLPHLKGLGFQEIVSYHHATNTPVLIAKLKAGFVISAMEINDSFGLLVRLTYYTNPTRRAMMAVRTGEVEASEELRRHVGTGG